jgi:hypothetical protein
MKRIANILICLGIHLSSGRVLGNSPVCNKEGIDLKKPS